jgi:hypothetical protein
MTPAADTTVGALQRAQLDASNNTELRSNAQEVVVAIRAARPKNTNLAYKPKQKEFRKWCEDKQYRDRDGGQTPASVKEVANRPLRAKSHKVDKSVPLDQTRLNWCSVRSYVTAVTDLYREQRAMGTNCHPTPREDNVRQYPKTLQRDTQHEKEQFADKGRDTLLDGYSDQDLERICEQLSANSEKSLEPHFRTLVDILLGHYLLARGAERQATKLSDLFTLEFTGEGQYAVCPSS